MSLRRPSRAGRRPLTPPPGSASLNAARRARELDELTAAGAPPLDVLVVGGGIVGAWVALDAAARGLRVALIERRDLAHGTSRWSSKLAHGGLRYLAHGDVAVAWESARERALLLDVCAPHLTRALPMLIPLGDHVGRRAAATIATGLRAGDLLRAAAGTSRRRLPPTRRIGAAEALRLAPSLAPDSLRGALLHWDAQLDDDARLVVDVARTAAAYGARILTYVTALELGADGARARVERGDDGAPDGTTFELRARHVVNATGVWAGELSGGAVALRPSKGSHLLVRADALGDPRAAVNAPLPGHSTRFAFALPRPDGLALVGITDEPFDGPIPDEPSVDAAEERFLLETIGRVLARPLRAEDVVGRFAGLRPLLAGDGETADLSRRHALIERDGVLTVVGGKLTTARRMAQDAVDRIAARPGVQAGACVTHRIRLVGADRPDAARVRAADGRAERGPSSGDDGVRLAGEALGTGKAGGDEDARPLAPGVPATREQLRFAVEHELALTVEDLLDRRTRLGLAPEWRAAALDAARAVLAAAGAGGA